MPLNIINVMEGGRSQANNGQTKRERKYPIPNWNIQFIYNVEMWCITLNCVQYQMYRMPSKDHSFSFIDIWDSRHDDNVQDSVKWILSNWPPQWPLTITLFDVFNNSNIEFHAVTKRYFNIITHTATVCAMFIMAFYCF